MNISAGLWDAEASRSIKETQGERFFGVMRARHAVPLRPPHPNPSPRGRGDHRQETLRNCYKLGTGGTPVPPKKKD
jgi:hypothetical protein